MDFNKDLAIYFLHLRKTAGTSLSQTITHSPLSPRLVSIDSLRDYFSSACFSPRNTFQGSVMRTHSFYGIHRANPRHLLNLSPYTYITILRDPIERAASFYFYAKRVRPQKYEHPSHQLANQVELQDFYKFPYNDNEQTRILSGYRSKNFKQCEQSLLDMAKENLSQSFTVVGITERFNDTVTLLNRTFDWQLDTSFAKSKINVKRPKLNDLSEETLDSLRENHKFDLELYDFATQLFEQHFNTELSWNN